MLATSKLINGQWMAYWEEQMKYVNGELAREYITHIYPIAGDTSGLVDGGEIEGKVYECNSSDPTFYIEAPSPRTYTEADMIGFAEWAEDNYFSRLEDCKERTMIWRLDEGEWITTKQLLTEYLNRPI